MRSQFWLFALAFFYLAFAKAQELQDLVNDPPYIKTVTFNRSAENMLPIYTLGETIALSFDDTIADEEDYYYQIEHYDYDWKSSTLAKNEFLTGVDNRRILNYRNSFTTLQSYSHYELQIPNQFTTALKVSGNYIIHIYNDDDELVFSRRFMIKENLAAVGVQIKRARDLDFVNTQQRVQFNIDSRQINFINPDKNLKVALIQNADLNSAIYNIQPQFNLGNNQVYKYDSQTSFWAGNEYLNFDNTNFRAPNNNIDYVRLEELYNAYLFIHPARLYQEYTFFPDINGNFLVSTQNNVNTDIQAEYVNIHFSLDPIITIPDGAALFVMGNFNGFQLQEENMMKRNKRNNLYESTIMLKQGFYNYRYALFDKNGVEIPGAISGNKWQTENIYTVLAYYREPGARFDRLIGIGEGSSVNISN
jgi:hypothetical protein